MTAHAQLTHVRPPLDRVPISLRSPSARYLGGVLLLAAAYFGAAKVGQTLRYTASVAAIWPPAGLGIAALYLWGLRWWPGIFVGEVLVNAELHLNDGSLPMGSLIGQQVGNMAEIIVGALLLRRFVGHRAALDRAEQVGGMLGALAIATAISATIGMTSMLLGGVIGGPDLPKFWRTWWLGDTAGGLVVLPLAMAWFPDPVAAWRCIRTYEGALLVLSVVGLGVLAFLSGGPSTYIVFPALIWAAFRFGPPGGALSIAIAAGVAVGFTANKVGPFFKQPIDHRTLSTQVYIVFAALTTLFLSALVSERERSAAELAASRRREEERAVEERHRIARDLHDSVSQALFSTILHTRAAQKALRQEGWALSGSLGQTLDAIGELIRGAQSEMRALIFELGHDDAVHEVHEGLVAALAKHAERLGARTGLPVDVEGPESLGISRQAEMELFGIGREALANVVKHAGARKAWVRVQIRAGRLVLQVIDDGCGFDPAEGHPGHFGLESMRSRARELGGILTISRRPGRGTLVRVETPAELEEASDGT
jgi:signal transduction histidine kinase